MSKKPERKGLLQKITMFGDPIPTAFGGILTALLPLILLGYGIWITLEKLENANAEFTNSTQLKVAETFWVKVKCVSNYGCIIADPLGEPLLRPGDVPTTTSASSAAEATEFANDPYFGDYEVADDFSIVENIVKLNKDEEETFRVTFYAQQPVLFVAHAACWGGNTTFSCSRQPGRQAFKPQINTKKFWAFQDRRGVLGLPRFPVSIAVGSGRELQPAINKKKPTSVWQMTVKVRKLFKLDNTTDISGFIAGVDKGISSTQPKIDSGSEKFSLLTKTCPASFLSGCSQGLIEKKLGDDRQFDFYGADFANFGSDDYVAPTGLYDSYDPSEAGDYFYGGDYSGEIGGGVGGGGGGLYGYSSDSTSEAYGYSSDSTSETYSTDTYSYSYYSYSGPGVGLLSGNVPTAGLTGDVDQYSNVTQVNYKLFNFAVLKIDPEVITAYERKGDPQQIALEVIGQIGGTYGIVVAALRGLHALYLFAIGKVSAKTFVNIASGKESGEQDKKEVQKTNEMEDV